MRLALNATDIHTPSMHILRWYGWSTKHDATAATRWRNGWRNGRGYGRVPWWEVANANITDTHKLSHSHFLAVLLINLTVVVCQPEFYVMVKFVP